MTAFGFDAVIFGLQRFGGISTYCWELLWRMARDLGDDLNVTMPKLRLGNRWTDVFTLGSGVQVEALPTQIARYLPCSNDSSLIFSSYYRTLRSERQKLVVPVYDFMYEKFRSGLALSVHGWQKSSACNIADAILCISQSTRTDLLEYYPAIDPARVHVIHLAVDHDRFFPEADHVPELKGCLLFVGQRRGYKRFDLAVMSARACGKRLAIVGPPLATDEMSMLKEKLGDRWIQFSAPDDRSLRRAYSSVQALIYPSDYEGFGLPLLEAQACGCPTIAACSSSLPEVGGTATFFAAQQKIDDYSDLIHQLNQDSKREIVRKAGLDNAASFRWDRTYSETMDIVSELL